MDNIASQVYDAELSHVIQLNPSQYSFYQENYIELLSPDGKHLELIGHFPKKSAEEENLCRLREQVCLLQTLLCNINEQIELPPLAVSGLADLMFRTQGLCERFVK